MRDIAERIAISHLECVVLSRDGGRQRIAAAFAFDRIGARINDGQIERALAQRLAEDAYTNRVEAAHARHVLDDVGAISLVAHARAHLAVASYGDEKGVAAARSLLLLGIARLYAEGVESPHRSDVKPAPRACAVIGGGLAYHCGGGGVGGLLLVNIGHIA